MKKQYIAPHAEVIAVETEAIIAASKDLNSETTSDQFQGGRRGSDWDEFEQ